MRYIKFLFIPIVFMIFGCEGRECRTQDNNNARIVLYDGLDKSRITKMSECFFDRYDLYIYGVNSNDLKQILTNAKQVENIKNVNMKVWIYKDEFKVIEKATKNGVIGRVQSQKPIKILRIKTSKEM